MHWAVVLNVRGWNNRRPVRLLLARSQTSVFNPGVNEIDPTRASLNLRSTKVLCMELPEEGYFLLSVLPPNQGTAWEQTEL
jgi:hypothetical protein